MYLLGWTLRKITYTEGVFIEAHGLSGYEGLALSVFQTEQEAERYRKTLKLAAQYKTFKVYLEGV